MINIFRIFIYPFLITLSVVSLFSGCATQSKPIDDYQNPELAAVQRSTDLVRQMTLQEKVSQMKYDAPAIPRLGVPAYNWWNECLHGVGRAGEATVFPQAIGLGATWNTDLMNQIGIAVSDEARAKHHKFVSEGKRGIYQGLTFWTPNINIFRDPRWGRGQETYGEDPYLTGRMAVNFINGLQGDDEQYLKVVATAKHFAVHSGPEKTRHSDNYQASDGDLMETYLPAFEAAVKEANVQSVMCAYNRFRDEACCGSNILLDSILRQEWGFDGYVVSDCWAINDFYMSGRHGVSSSAEEASALAVKTGTDLNCGNTFDPNLSEAVLAEYIDEEEVDKALIRLMTARFKLGMFDDESNVRYAQIPYSVVRSNDHLDLSLKAARESIVLLKNENDILPLSKELKKVAVIGPNANTRQALLGNYHGTSPDYITPLDGIRKKLPNAQVSYMKGSDITSEWPLLTPIPAANLRSDGKEGLSGQYFANNNWEGAPEFTRQDDQVDFVWIERPIKTITTDTFTVRWNGELIPDKSGQYRIGLRACNAGKLYLNGEKVVDFTDDHQPTMRYYDVELEEGNSIDIRIDYYNWHADPQVQLLWAKSDEDLVTPAVELVKNSDVALLFLGLSPDIEGEEMPVVMEGFDKGDRSDIVLPRSQRELMKAVVETGKPVVLILMNGSALAINYAADKVPAVLEAWYPGEFGGQAISDVLFGDYNPAGRLPLTYYSSAEELPEFTSYDMTERTYKYYSGNPLYSFGYGLSYTEFKYSNLSVAESKDGWKVAVELQNTGERPGDEVVQVYVSFPDMPTAPQVELVAFKRVSIDEGKSEAIEFLINKNQVKVFGKSGESLPLSGRMILSVGGKQPGEKQEKMGVLMETVAL
ncbi:MAG: glycoside hydrolase family 3 C-terminal domain-containing protein [Cyclobacteriaceae bacterium]